MKFIDRVKGILLKRNEEEISIVDRFRFEYIL